jgi:hypothetical protein
MVNNKKIFGFRPSCRGALHQLMPATLGVPASMQNSRNLNSIFWLKGCRKITVGNDNNLLLFR